MTDADLQNLKSAVTRLSELVDQLRAGTDLSSLHSVVDEAANLAGQVQRALTTTQTQFRIQGGPRTGSEPR